MRRRFLLYSVVILLCFALIASGCSTKEEQKAEVGSTENGSTEKKVVTMRYTHGCGLDDPHHWVAEKFKELVEEYSDGQVQVTIFPAGQMGSEDKGFADVQQKIVEATSLAINNVPMFVPEMGIFDLPYIFASRDDFYKVIDTLWDDYNDVLIKGSGNRAIIWFEQGFRNLTNSKRPVETIDDLQGLKIRVSPNEIMIAAFEAWGNSAVPMAWDEVFNALQQGVIDGQENPYTVNNSMRFQEVQKYITDIHYKMWIGPVVVNEEWLQSQPEDIREIIIKAGKDTSLAVRDHIQTLEKEALESLIAGGMVYSGSPKDEDVWQKKAESIWPRFYETIGGTEVLLEKTMKVLGREVPR